jgi:uncharacterized delta-60 repeat protein
VVLFDRMRARVLVSTAALLVVVLAVTLAYAGSAGHLDRSFGHRGIAVVRGVHGVATSVAVGRRNRIVVAGPNPSEEFKVARVLGDGDVDRQFGHRGVVKVGFGEDRAAATSVALNRKGGIVVAGTVCSDLDTCQFAVARLLRNGKVDRSFGDNGKAEIAFPKPYGFDPSVALESTGRIVVGGSACESDDIRDCDVAIAALRRDGRLDPRFGNGGKVVSHFPRPEACREGIDAGTVQGMDIDSRGRVVVGGSCLGGGHAPVARFTANGDPDPSFGNDGIVDPYVGMARIGALVVDARDRIDVAGARHHGLAVARFEGSGRLDRSFGRRGVATARFVRHPNAKVGAQSVVIDSVGRILVGGFREDGAAFARFKPNGDVSRRFGRGGAFVLRGNKNGLWNGTSVLAVDSRDRVVAAGADRFAVHFALIRLLG